MPKLDSWADLFKFNKELLDDDYNPGQGLVVKSKYKSIDETTEFSNTFKQSTLNADNEAKINLETKIKSSFSGTTNEFNLKNDGSLSYDLKWDILERKSNVKGLHLAYNLSAQSKPTNKAPEHKIGIDFSNADLKLKWLSNFSSFG